MKQDFDFDVNMDDFSDIEFEIETEFETRIIKPPRIKEMPETYLKYKYAVDLVKKINIEKGCYYFCIINGSFISGDFIEALIVENNFHVKKMTVSTLSMSQNNIDSFNNLIKGNFLDEFNLIISDYFFSHERNGLVKYAYEKLDIDNKFQLAVAGTHCKNCLIETHCGKKIFIHGSNNLRSSGNIEEFSIHENEYLFDYNNEYLDKIIEVFKTINKDVKNKIESKSVRSKSIWDAVLLK